MSTWLLVASCIGGSRPQPPAAPVAQQFSSAASSGAGGGDSEPDPGDLIARALVFDLPEPKLDAAQPEALWATYYYVPKVTHLDAGFVLRDMGGRRLAARLSRRDWCEAAMQGTVLVDLGEGRSATFNYAGTKKNTEVDCTAVYPKHGAIGRTRFTSAVGPFGDGVRGMVLIPFRTIAVDPNVIPFGSLVYIPAARGAQLTLPDGGTAIHDGYFFAADRGGAIKTTHIDVFVGVGTRGDTTTNPFAFVKSKSTATFDAHVLAADDAAEAHERLSDAHRALTRRP